MNLQAELRTYLDTLVITSDNIGEIRCSLFMPWDSAWNGIVRDETAAREVSSAPKPAPTPDMYGSDGVVRQGAVIKVRPPACYR